MKETLRIEGMHCGGCIASVKRAIERLPVATVDVSFGTAIVEYDDTSVTHEAIVAAIEDAGYAVESPAG